MTRPLDWSPLAEVDPVPGDPDGIAAEAAELRRAAEDMRAQIRNLRGIGANGLIVGRAGESLYTAAEDLAGQLERTVGRYEQVAGALDAWAPRLREGQQESVSILARAKSADGVRADNAALPATGRAETPAETAEAARRYTARERAGEALATERGQLADLVNGLDRDAGVCANRITAAVEDSIVDSAWDDVDDFVDRNAETIKTITDVASTVGTVLAVAAMFATGPLGLIVGGTVLALGVGTAASQGLLAATGNGSWADVGTAVFGLATLGVGKIATTALKTTSVTTRTAGAAAAGRAAERASLATTRPKVDVARRVLAKADAPPNIRELANRRVATSLARAQEHRDAARLAERQRLPAAPRLGDKILTGDRAAAADVAAAREVRTTFADDPHVAAVSAGLGPQRVAAAGATIGGLGVDVADKAMTPPFEELFPPTVPAYKAWKDQYQYVDGSTW